MQTVMNVNTTERTDSMNKNAEGYSSPTEFEALARIRHEEKMAAKRKAFRPIVYICSPYSGDTGKNIKNARKYSRFAVDSNCLPITPHIYFTQFMNDSTERQTAMQLNRILLSKCRELWVFGSIISKGMKQEIQLAKSKRIRIRYFTEELEET